MAANRQRVLIVDERLDRPARLVAVALKERGHDVWRWHIDEQAVADASVLVQKRHAPQVVLPACARPLDPSVVWWRCGHFPRLPASLAPPEAAMAQQEWPLFLRGVEQLLAGAWHVNPQEARRRANAKALQLALAVRCGLNVPRTLFTNDAARAREFIAANAKNWGTVVKLQALHEVHDGVDRAYTSRTRRVFVRQVPSAAAMRAVPVILQERIRKAYELRVTIFGRSVFAARIDNSELQDYRSATNWHELNVRPTRLPASIAASCFRLMHTLGIVAGSFDFVVARDGTYFFLEVNEQGEFLWLERLCPDFHLLDAFCGFLASAARDYRWTQTRGVLRLSELEATAAARSALQEDEAAARRLQRRFRLGS